MAIMPSVDGGGRLLMDNDTQMEIDLSTVVDIAGSSVCQQN